MKSSVFILNLFILLTFMILKTRLPKTCGTRHLIQISKNLLCKNFNIVKNLKKGLKKFSGRSSSNGRITVRHQGGGCKKSYKILNFNKTKISGLVIFTYYDSFRGSFISLNFDFTTNTFFNTLATDFVFPGCFVFSSIQNSELKLGYKTALSSIPPGSIVHSLILNKDSFVKYARSAGTSCQIIQRLLDTCKVRLPSGKIITVSGDSFATLGKVSNSLKNQTVIGKAGTNRLKGIRPSVRGIAMNPVDHPHGGRTNGGMPSVTPWGIPTKGKPTVKKKI